MTTKWWIEGGTFLTMDDGQPIVNGHLVVEGSRIVYLAEAHPGALADGAERISGSGLLFMPGLINTHGHAAMTLLRGYARTIWRCRIGCRIKSGRLEARFTAEDVRAGAALAAARC